MKILDRFCNTQFESYEDFYNNFKINVPENFNFAYDVIDVYAKESPEQRAVLWVNDKGLQKTLTYKQLSDYSQRAANVLCSLGLKKGDKVILLLKRRWQFWGIVIACLRVGVTVIPATHQLTGKDLTYRVSRSGAKMVIMADDDYIEKTIASAEEKGTMLIKASVNGARDGYVDFDAETDKASEVFEKPSKEDLPDLDDVMLIYFTSGTTGMPKMVAHDYRLPLGHILTGCFWQNLRDDDLHFTLSDTGWAKCSWGKLWGQWIAGSCVFVYDYDSHFAPLDMAKMIEKYKITTFCAPPTVFRFLIKEDISGIDLSSLRATYIAGEPLNAEVYKKWYDLTGLLLREGYGQSETPVMVACFPWIEPKPGSMGKPSPIMRIRLLNPKGEFCEVGEEGEICVDMRDGHPVGLFSGYLADEEKTGSVMFGGWYHTGDVAWMDEDGYYWFVGRSDDVIKSSGYRIGPFEVESALVEHKAVLETAITAVPDPVRGQIVKATVVLAKGYTPSDELKKELQEHVKKTTAPYKYPRIVEFVEELPKTISGKIRRMEIRQKDENQ